MATHILIVEDDVALNQMLTLHFEDLGIEVANAFSCTEALQVLEDLTPDLILLDQQLPDGLGSDLLLEILRRQPLMPVIMMTGQHDLELAIQAIKNGATDFVHKPVSTELLQKTVAQVLDKNQSTTTLRESSTEVRQERDLVGRSAAMLKVSKDIALSAESNATVLITGESGTGKEIVARLIHQHSNRSGPFVTINCAAIVDTLLESELFGHEKGAFTGANSRKPGKFELANDGTLFLDEIGELAPQLQAKLLRVLQEHTYEPVGSTRSMTSNARIIAATHKDLFKEAAEGHFREDLAYRLNVINIKLPSLKDRPEDIPLLANALLGKAASNIGKTAPPIEDTAMQLLIRHEWPGNVRELENVLTQALVQARDSVITADLIQLRPTAQVPHQPASEPDIMRSLEQVEASHIQQVLNYTGGHKGKSCEILAISRPALDRKIKKYRLKLPN